MNTAGWSLGPEGAPGTIDCITMVVMCVWVYVTSILYLTVSLLTLGSYSRGASLHGKTPKPADTVRTHQSGRTCVSGGRWCRSVKEDPITSH